MSATVKVRALGVPLRDGAVLRVPYWDVVAPKAGPCLLVVAAQHGNELQGIEAMRRFVAVAGEKLVTGRILAVPFGNLPAIREHRPHLGMSPEQPYSHPRSNRLNMNLYWPGRRAGTAPRRVAAAIAATLLPHATHVLDLHTWNRSWMPALLIREMPGLRELARSLGPQLIHVRPPDNCTLAGYACSRGVPGMSYEFSGQYRVTAAQAAEGLRLLCNLACAIGLFRGQPKPAHVPVFLDTVNKVPVPAPVAGLFVGAARLAPSMKVRAGDSLGHVLSSANLATVDIRAPAAGMLWQFGVGRDNCDVAMTGHHPYVEPGETVAILLCAKA
ncbi:MAG: hypothetical protein A3K19_25125 [Lentisphaerae bacterium RIFOXYB12_FULL_65_16]|nr:MAG: hypothetical protein A3K18_00780 [Lentisphaerae bacterium RIFOXYA12_64_32]OGV91028.1 MAG: hypothetical protein A3K19_25125 [Lentisphaerae bacterium RIFOXYB12_FULL_65_16]